MDPIEKEVKEKAGHLSIRQQKILEQFLVREYKENGMEDYVYGQDDEFAEAGAKN